MSSVSKVHRSLWNESNISIVINKEEEIERKIKKKKLDLIMQMRLWNLKLKTGCTR